MCFGGGGDGGARARQLEQEAKIKAATEDINKVFAGYGPAFYAQRAKDYENYALPELARQFGQQQKQATYKLAGSGLGKSSAARDLNQQLQFTKSQQQQNIANAAMGQANQLKQQMAQQQQGLISQANMASDPASIANAALTTASTYAAPSAFAPIGDLFSNFANQYLTRQNAFMYGGQPTQQGGMNFNLGTNYGVPSMLNVKR
jgi:hypothetical protein